ncbi:uncharacterized protein [Musca autumnalis]|uniref:uncharacterized protein n=1 Tax=Musca autumnalis TaxID=221902 RepID=UPI003CF724F6
MLLRAMGSSKSLITINGQFFRKGNNGYRLFMYNSTTDYCRFVKNPNSHIFWKLIYRNAIVPSSNLNHSCPYDHDIIIDNLILDGSMFRLIPFPADEYMIGYRVSVHSRLRAEVKAYFIITD